MTYTSIDRGHVTRPVPRPGDSGRPRTRPVGILGTGACLPEKVLTNADLERMVDTSDEWIVTRTGMRERRIAAPDEATSDLATAATRRALDQAGLAPEDLQLIVLATSTPDTMTPSTACWVQEKLGAHNAAGFDIGAACSGFLNAQSVAHSMVASGAYDNAVVIGADCLSRITDYECRESCVLFGDGAGAVVLGCDAPTDSEVIDHILGMDGSGAAIIQVPAGGSRRPSTNDTIAAHEHYLQLQGREVFKFAVQKMADTVREITERNGFGLDDLDLVVPHQANLRILEAAAKRLGMPMERFAVNIDRTGNTAAASIPLALDEAARDGRLTRGKLVCEVAFGGGLTWGAALLRW